MLIRILVAVIIFGASALTAVAQEKQMDVVRITFEHNGISVLTTEGKEYQLQEWVSSFARPNREICPTCTPKLNVHFVPSKDGKMSVVTKAEMWGEIDITITLNSNNPQQ